MASKARDMNVSGVDPRVVTAKPTRTRRLLREFWDQRILYLMILPGILYFLIFRYYPMYGAVLAFKDYSVPDGILAAPESASTTSGRSSTAPTSPIS